MLSLGGGASRAQRLIRKQLLAPEFDGWEVATAEEAVDVIRADAAG